MINKIWPVIKGKAKITQKLILKKPSFRKFKKLREQPFCMIIMRVITNITKIPPEIPMSIPIASLKKIMDLSNQRNQNPQQRQKDGNEIICLEGSIN